VGEFIKHEPCPECGSRDNLARYDNGSGWCWGCKTYFAPSDKPTNRVYAVEPRELREGIFDSIPNRSLTEATCRKFGYHTDAGRTWQAADYYNSSGARVAQKVRKSGKKFSWVGDPSDTVLFGQQLWKPTRRVVVTEGEIDAMSVAQAQGLRWPVVSVPNGASGAKQAFVKNLEWLEQFEAVVILFDQDEPGEIAAVECAEVLTPGKAHIGRMPRKDANEMLVAGEVRELVDVCWQAAPYRPDGIVAGVDLIERVLAPPPPSIDYPWVGLNSYLRGQRTEEITCWCGGTGAGKSQLVREIAFSLHQKGVSVGVIALEESVRKAALSQVSLAMNEKLHDPEVRAKINDGAIRRAAGEVLDGMYFYDHFGSVEADVLIPKIRYMVKALEVEWVILDHVSIMVSEMAAQGDERKRLDELMTKLRTTVQESSFGMHIVAHLRKAGGTPHEEGGRITLDDLRGSGALKQISDNIVAAERDQQAQDESVRNTTTLRVLKCREFGDTGTAAAVRYSKTTGRITEHYLDSLGGNDEEKKKKEIPF
jgi:twinkle protein